MVTEETISNELTRIETEHRVKVLFACESGSRAWGFPSPDSDYDVRFIYLHHPSWYLTILPGRDVIEVPISGELDVSGWDLKKALGLMRKSNPPLLEWLDSDIVYYEDPVFRAEMRKLGEAYFSPKSCMYHYLSMAKHNYREHMLKEEVKLKKYFYILRPVLACRWLESRDGPAPISFKKLVAAVLGEGELRREIENLIEVKERTPELGKGPRIPVISDYIEQEMERLESLAPELDANKQPTGALNTFFHATLKRYHPDY